MNTVLITITLLGSIMIMELHYTQITELNYFMIMDLLYFMITKCNVLLTELPYNII